MSNARQSESWNHTACLLALTANINRDSRRQRKPFSIEMFHPFLKPKKPSLKAKMESLRQIFAPYKDEA